jgi:hypothetical protein
MFCFISAKPLPAPGTLVALPPLKLFIVAANQASAVGQVPIGLDAPTGRKGKPGRGTDLKVLWRPVAVGEDSNPSHLWFHLEPPVSSVQRSYHEPKMVSDPLGFTATEVSDLARKPIASSAECKSADD